MLKVNLQGTLMLFLVTPVDKSSKSTVASCRKDLDEASVCICLESE